MSYGHRALLAALAAILPLGGARAAGDNYFPPNPYDQRFCAGLAQQFRSENAARIGCTSATTAIVVEYFDYWPEAVGQSLALAARTGLAPGIVLVCRNDHRHCENAAAAVVQAFAHSATPLTLWDCSLTDASLSDCDKLQ